MRIRLALALILVATAASARPYTSDRCTCSFTIPDNWRVETRPGCWFLLSPAVWPPRNDPRAFRSYAIEIHVQRGRDFRDAAREMFFEEAGGKWILRGRLDIPFAATSIRSDDWFGLQGTATVGYHLRDGRTAPPDDAFRAVLGNRRGRTATFMADNPHSGGEFTALVQSFRFH